MVSILFILFTSLVFYLSYVINNILHPSDKRPVYLNSEKLYHNCDSRPGQNIDNQSQKLLVIQSFFVICVWFLLTMLPLDTYIFLKIIPSSFSKNIFQNDLKLYSNDIKVNYEKCFLKIIFKKM